MLATLRFRRSLPPFGQVLVTEGTKNMDNLSQLGRLNLIAPHREVKGGLAERRIETDRA